MSETTTSPLYVYVTAENTDTLPHNSVDFRVNISPPLINNGDWKCALLECDFGNNWDIKSDELEIYCDIVKPSLVNGIWERLLHKTKVNSIFPNKYYKTVDKVRISSIHFLITGSKGVFPPSITPEKTSLVLIFKRDKKNQTPHTTQQTISQSS